MTARNVIYDAVFALADEVTWGSGKVFKTKSRRVKLFSDVDKRTQQPALYQAEHGEMSKQKSGMPYVHMFKIDWIIYFDATAGIPAEEMNQILDSIYEVIAPKVQDPGFFEERNTLLGLVYHCFIDGEVFKDPGDIDGQAMAVVPIRLLVP